MTYLKALAKRVAPKSYNRLQEARGKRLLAAVTEQILNRYGAVVQNGPFAGMRFSSEASAGSLVPKIIGSYECELHETLLKLLSIPYRTIVNIGCAEGYYAVGLARLFPSASVHAFDLDARARDLCREIADANKVSISIYGRCSNNALTDLLENSERSLVVSDCEGGELELLDPTCTGGFAKTDFLVELHDFINADISSVIIERFKFSHEITIINSTGREPAGFPSVQFLQATHRKIALSEFRPENMQWAFMTPKRH